MERESFEDEEVAQLLNDHFVCIKVDREERPDIDSVYMTACQALTGQGGWPLTAVLTPKGEPFYAGTYFPRRGAHGRPGMLDLIPAVADAWENRRERVLEMAGTLAADIARLSSASSAAIDTSVLEDAVTAFWHEFDEQYGGFGSAPKFPAAHHLVFLSRMHAIANDERALSMVEKTLVGMWQGGMWDHIGFGFARYSTDERWLVPHFEKMLYDNALLALSYTEAYARTGKAFYREVTQSIFSYIRRELTSPEGGFYSAQDADAGGVEGASYVFTPGQIEEALGEEDGRAFCAWFGITPGGNFEGASIPNRLHARSSVGSGDSLAGDVLESLLPDARMDELRGRVLAVRAKRVAPALDDKILLSWNSLMIGSLAYASRIFGDADLSERASRALEFVERTFVREDGRLLARHRDGHTGVLAYLDDYAWLAWSHLQMFDGIGDARHLQRASELVLQAHSLFADVAGGGYWLTGSDGESLFARPRELYDGAMPSGNSAMAVVLSRLAQITGQDSLRELRDRQLQSYAAAAKRQPTAFSWFWTAHMNLLYPTTEVVVVLPASQPGTLGSERDAARLQQAISELRRADLPNVEVVIITADNAEPLVGMCPWMAAMVAQRVQEPRIFICHDNACERPLQGVEPVVAVIRQMTGMRKG